MKNNKNYDFDKTVNRCNTGSVKWDLRSSFFPNSNVTPLWVADADWPTAPEIIDALKNRLDHGVFGYTFPDKELKSAVCDWYINQYNWSIKPEWLTFISGVVPGIRVALEDFTSEDAGILIQPPVYYPFFDVIEKSRRNIIENPLDYDPEIDRYRIDFRNLKRNLKDNPSAEALILCSPHNPVGRVWSKKELNKLGKLCRENGITIISDEIHSDFTFGDHQHIPLASLSKELAHNTITLHSPTKTFNLAGLKIAFAVIPDREKRRSFRKAADRLIKGSNIMGYEGLRAAYKEGKNWLGAQLEYLEGNLNTAGEICGELQGINLIEPEGTYLVWMDFSNSAFSSEEISHILFHRAEVGLEPGEWFGEQGEGFYRLNLATPRSQLQDALQRLAAAWKSAGG